MQRPFCPTAIQEMTSLHNQLVVLLKIFDMGFRYAFLIRRKKASEPQMIHQNANYQRHGLFKINI